MLCIDDTNTINNETTEPRMHAVKTYFMTTGMIFYWSKLEFIFHNAFVIEIRFCYQREVGREGIVFRKKVAGEN